MQIGFREMLKNDEDAPIRRPESVMMIPAIAMELILRLLRRF